ncbi:hypothetical protein KAFR_0E04500 [Kazachstania africana CBS 2517]|uniref:Uncharacterized protein n=1 Tax=Kazachstania africana (strain ATCC 22294 / BCRC 22015 / CBS 2517 / CECT 1963 / NBRC 1671 / NRRL Y-8276) TaxID=1071382 RepID=H2AW51_KAZAF|nr:hypothetical protein KAFR_0E04500 [Kazachstania africana CBS 2517]CCF58601.1 hypothetical protein KAFR_0E04500 [Kazachstania africana CBS 2517]
MGMLLLHRKCACDRTVKTFIYKLQINFPSSSTSSKFFHICDQLDNIMSSFFSFQHTQWRVQMVDLFFLIVALGLVKRIDAIPVRLAKRVSINKYVTKAGITFFQEVANDISQVKGIVCSASAIAGVTGLIAAGFAVCVGTLVVGAMASALAAGLREYAADSQWEWYKGSAEVGKRSDVVSFDLPKLNMTFFGGPAVTSQYYEVISTYLLEHTSNITFLAQAQTGTSNQITKRDEGDYFVTWTFDRGDFNTTVYARPESVASAAAALLDHISNGTTLQKRDEGEWASFNTYGMNVIASNLWMLDEGEQIDEAGPVVGNWITSQVQSCTNSPECYAVESKFCLAIGASSTPGDTSIIVGEAYIQAFGGIDNECDSL